MEEVGVFKNCHYRLWQSNCWAQAGASIVKHKNKVWVTVKNNIDKIVQEELKEIPGVTDVEIYENTVMVYSMHESENLESIIAYFTSKGLGILQIESKVPDLETVFLTLTGRKLRD